MSEDYPELQEFVLQNVQRTGICLGKGAYGDVEELCWNGTKCAGKRLHHFLLETERVENTALFADKFISECKTIAKIRHPNVVQFLGLYFFRDHNNHQIPILVMEKLQASLHSLLDDHSNIKVSVKCSILLDVTRGLVHLHSHSPPIIHRDLTSRNILLTSSLQAKIADLGTARMLGSQKLAQYKHRTPMPGTPIFMPPEANDPKPSYDTKLDVFSFGHLMLHTLTQVLPCELLPAKYQTPGSDKMKGRNEVERRKHYMEMLISQFSKEHKLVKLVTCCLADLPKRRPTAKEVMKAVEEFCSELENCGDHYDLFSQILALIQADKNDGKLPTTVESEGRFDLIQRERTKTFVQQQILKGQPCLLKIYQSGGLFRRNAEWKEFVFKIRDGKFQYYGLNDHLQGEILLSKVEYTKGFWSPNTKLFPFHVHFRGRGSPWILGAYSKDERLTWMEAIKPGSTLNQWVRPNIEKPKTPSSTNPPPISEPPPPVPPRSPASYDDSPYAAASELFTEDDLKKNSLQASSKPELKKLESECPYVPASELNIPVSCNSNGLELNAEVITEPASSDYLPLISVMDGEYARCSSQLEDGIIKELSEQFDPVQIDLLVQMFKTDLSTADENDSLSNMKTNRSDSLEVVNPNESLNPLSHRHIGYAKEGRTSPYRCLADIALKLSEVDENSFTKDDSETKKDHGINENSLYNSVDEVTSLPTSFHRKNAMRCAFKTRPRSVSEGNQTLSDFDLLKKHGQKSGAKVPEFDVESGVSTLCALLRRASVEGMLDDTVSECPLWSRANTVCSSTTKLNRMSMYSSDTELDLFLSQEDLINFQQIGEGQFGPVYRAERITDNASVPVALKPIKSRISSEEDITIFLREMAVLKCVRHPNVVQVYGLVDDANWIVMEYLPNGDLKTFLSCKKPTVSCLLKYMLDISMGMHYLSAKGLVHRKLAARNILVSETEVCKVGDLELGSQRDLTEDNLMNTSPQDGVKDPNKILRWMSPESLTQHLFSPASDVWSYGVTLWEMFNPTKLPYEECDDKACLERISKGQVMDIPENCPEIVKKIMKACWYRQPGNRPSFLYMSTLLNNALLQ